MDAPADISLFAVSYGTSLFERKYIFAGDTSGASDPFDWLFYVLRTEDRIILIDTGFRDPALAAQYGVTIRDVHVPLRDLGIEAADVTDIVITHADFDHSDNIDLFPSARIVIQKDELQRILDVADIDASAHLASFLQGNPRVEAFQDAVTVAGFLEVERVGGHTVGSSVVRFTWNEGVYLFPGDECYVETNAREGKGIGYVRDAERNRQYVQSLKSAPNTVILPFHDPAVLQCYPQVKEGVAQIL